MKESHSEKRNGIRSQRILASLLSLCVLLLIIAMGASSRGSQSRAQDEASPLIFVPSFQSGRIMTPRSRETLEVMVTDRSGEPLSNMDVFFVAPAAGASGSFAEATGEDTSFYQTRTNAKGIATATFVANNLPGVYLVDAVIEGTEMATSFGMTNVPRRVRPRLAADQARQVVVEQFLSNQTEDEMLRLHGPVLLETGTQIASAGSSSFLYPTTPLTIDRQMWFFWVDEIPLALFAHPTQFILLDASNREPNFDQDAIVTREGWWPEMSLPGAGESTALLPPSYTRAIVGSAATRLSRVPRTTPRELSKAQPAADTCAIVIQGPDFIGFDGDVNDMKEFFEESLNIPTSNIFTRTDSDGNSIPSRVRDLEEFLNAAKDRGCKKLLLYISAHGGPAETTEYTDSEGNPRTRTESGGLRLAEDPDTANIFVRDGGLSYSRLADFLKPLGETNTEVCLIIDACYSGSAIPDLQGYGVSGTVVTSSNADRVTLAYVGFTDSLLKCWKDFNADNAPRDGRVTLEEAFNWVLENGGFTGNLGKPQIATIGATSDVYPIPNIVIQEAGQKATIAIRRPAGVLQDVGLTVTLVSQDPTVAWFLDGGSTTINLPPGTLAQTVEIFGRRDGVINYGIQGRDADGRMFQGTASIQVGSGYFIRPNPVTLCVGQEVAVTLRRSDLLQQTGVASVLVKSANNNIATVNPIDETVVFGRTNSETTIRIIGFDVGTTTITVTDRAGRSTSFKVIVEPCPCDPDGKFDVDFTLEGNQCRHPIRLDRATLEIIAVPEVNEVGIFSEATNLTSNAHGSFDGTCPFHAAGQVDVMTTDGRTLKGVSAAYWITGVFGDRIEGTYALGVDGDLPGGCPITWSFTGTRQPEP